MNREMLEVLIGKYLDSEISPAEQRLLDQELVSNQAARELLEAWRTIDEAAGDALAGCGGEIAAGETFENAWTTAAKRREKGKRVWGRQRILAWGRWAALLAIGFGLGLAAYNLTLEPTRETPAVVADEEAADTNGAGTDVQEDDVAVALGPTDEEEPLERITPAEAARRKRLARLGDGSERPMDYYSYTDPSGGEWLIEGYRNDEVRAVGYDGDL